MLGDVQDRVEPEQVGEQERADRRRRSGRLIASSIDLIERPRSSCARQTSDIPDMRIRLTTKPGTSPQVIGCFLMAWAKFTAAVSVSVEVSSPSTTSISGMTDAG